MPEPRTTISLIRRRLSVRATSRRWPGWQLDAACGRPSPPRRAAGTCPPGSRPDRPDWMAGRRSGQGRAGRRHSATSPTSSRTRWRVAGRDVDGAPDIGSEKRRERPSGVHHVHVVAPLEALGSRDLAASDKRGGDVGNQAAGDPHAGHTDKRVRAHADDRPVASASAAIASARATLLDP